MKLSPFTIRDLRKGVIRKSILGNFLIPENSVSHSLNVNYDIQIGNAVVRSGTTLLGSAVASNKTPLGLSNFVGTGGSPNLMLAVYSGAANASIYYYDTSWHTSGTTTLNNSAKNRFATLGGRVFRVSSGDAMTSSVDGNTWATTDCITTDSVIPTLVFRAKGRLLASGYSGFKDRVYFSSVIDPNASPFITWSTNPSTGDWIDINPDDGGNITAFAETSNNVIVFKDTGMYRLDVVSKTTTTQNIFNIGAVSQEAVVNCQGVIYFFSGLDIRRTVGDYPEQISRLGVQDFIDAIPQSSWANIGAGTDGLNVYFSIGDVTLFTNQDEQVTYNKVVLKFSPRDEAWSIHSYAQAYRFFSQFKTSSGYTFVGADTAGNVQTLNSGQTDNTAPIFYELETQELEFGNRVSLKKMSDKISVLTNNGIDSQLQIKSDIVKDYQTIKMDLSNRVNTGKDLPDVEGHYFTFRWFGNSSKKNPTLEGIFIPTITDQGIFE
jgi:hypothetical protein